MISQDLSIQGKATLLSLNCSPCYYKAAAVSQDTVAVMNDDIQDLHARYPFMGYWWITVLLREQGYKVNGKRILRPHASVRIKSFVSQGEPL
jgi:hypothetical protein